MKLALFSPFVVVYLATVSICPALRAQTATTSRADFLQYRWVDTVDHPGSHRYFDASGQSYVLNDSIILGMRDIKRAEVYPNRILGESGWDVIVRLSPAAVSVFAATTANHIGQRIAVLIDDRIVWMAIVQSRLGAVVGVTFNTPKAVADSVAARINEAKLGAGPAP